MSSGKVVITPEVERTEPPVPAVELSPVRRRWGLPRSAPEPFEADDEEQQRGAWIPIAFAVVVVLAFLIRLAASEQLSSHVDESASIMAAHDVADKGVPIFPSGTLYLQGATLSYILAPAVWAGHGDLDDLQVLRFPSVLAGTGAVIFLFFLTRFLTGNAAAGLIAAFCLTVDPISVRWSAYVRMYALLQMLTILAVWLFFRLLFSPPNRKGLFLFVAVFWVAVFTHIAALLIWPGLALGALLIHRWSLKDRRRDLSIALGACLGAPVVLLFLNQLVEPPDKAVNEAVPGVRFVGDYFVSLGQLLHPNVEAWLLLFGRGPLHGVMPTVVVAGCCLLIGRYFLSVLPNRTARSQRTVIGLLLLLYWIPIGLVAGFANSAEDRYLLHIHPIGYLLFTILIADLLGWRGALAWSGPGAMTATASVETPRQRFRVRAPRADDGELDDWEIDQLLRAKPAAEPEAEVAVTPLSERTALILFGAIFAFAAGFRIYHLYHLSLWLDEGFTVLYSRLPWGRVLGFDGYYSPHPPLFFGLVKAVSLVVREVYAARLISVICALATFPVFFALAARLLDRRAALVSTGVLAISPLSIYYAQEGRMYALLVFLVAVAYLALIHLWDEPAWTWAAIYGLAGVLAVYVDYSAVFALAPQAIPLAIIALKHKRKALPIGVALAGAVILYAPYLPTVLDTVNHANEETRREDYLGAQSDRIGTAILSILGIAGDHSYFYGSKAAPWNRFEGIRVVLVALFLPIIALGLLSLWRRKQAFLFAGCLFGGTLLVSIWISLISPGFAERTVLTATLGWALIVGAAFREGLSKDRLALGVASSVTVIGITLLTTSAVITGAQKQDWKDAAAAVDEVAPLGMPLVTYSYGGVADVLIDVYQPDLLDAINHVTIRDGELENTLSGGLLHEIGLTRADAMAGKLAEALPASDPANNAVWYVYAPRTGETDIHQAFLNAGYERVFRRLYDHTRYKVWFDLYVRTGTTLGTPMTINGSFANNAEGWTIPETAGTISGDTLTLSAPNASATLDVPVTGEGVYTLTADALTASPTTDIQTSVSCISSFGQALVTSTTDPPAASETSADWTTHRVAAWCPADTVTVRITLTNLGNGDLSYRNVTLDDLAFAGSH
jgi:uncharacterized membrane protein